METYSMPPTRDQIDLIRATASTGKCQPGNLKCPFYMTMSATFKFCKLKNGADCPVNGMTGLPDFDSKEFYRNALLRILKAWNERHEVPKSDFADAMHVAAAAVGFTFNDNAFTS